MRAANVEAWMVRGLGWVVPAGRREDWRREWRAELWQVPGGPVAGRDFGRASLLRGMMADAIWLRLDGLSGSLLWSVRRRSAAGCLVELLALSVLSVCLEWMLAGSWRGMEAALLRHFLGCFLFVGLPGLFVALATAALRPRKCQNTRMHVHRLLSAGVRWRLFLGVKVLLTVAAAFLGSAVVALAARRVMVFGADWVELLSTSLMLILSVKWALENQERRCQHCLRMLSRPTRVGMASRNFLEWNGTELICAEGHGLLHVTEMHGSWCWYDVWVELDPTWQGLFRPQVLRGGSGVPQTGYFLLPGWQAEFVNQVGLRRQA